MSKNIARIASTFLALSLLASVAACGGGGGSDATGILNLSVTDTPVDGAQNVVIAFTGVDLMGPNGMHSYTFPSERTLDLLQLQGNASAALLDNVTVPAGSYQWLQLDVDMANSYVMSSTGGKFPLSIPSGSESGLKLVSGFTVSQGSGQGSIAAFTIDFDLRQSLTLDNAGGNTTYTLKPALRLINEQQAGSVTGTVPSALYIGGIPITATTCSPAVYVFSGAGVVPQGYNMSVTGGTSPLTSATVALDTTTGNYTYTVGFLAPGSYTLAVTCAAMDTPGVPPLAFTNSQTATVASNTSTTINF